MNPWVKNPWAIKNPGPFREGDRVEFQLGAANIVGIVSEDRGLLGVGGTRLYGITFCMDDANDPSYTEVHVDELRLVERASANGNGSPH